MKRLITLLCVAFMVACGSPSATTTTTEPIHIGPPWEALSDADSAAYVEVHGCEAATRIMTEMMEWVVVPGSVVEEVSPGRFVSTVQSESGEVGVVQYREGGTRVFELGVLMLDAENMILFIDYNVIRAFHTGAASPDDESALELATGEYFCVYK